MVDVEADGREPRYHSPLSGTAGTAFRYLDAPKRAGGIMMVEGVYRCLTIASGGRLWKRRHTRLPLAGFISLVLRTSIVRVSLLRMLHCLWSAHRGKTNSHVSIIHKMVYSPFTRIAFKGFPSGSSLPKTCSILFRLSTTSSSVFFVNSVSL